MCVIGASISIEIVCIDVNCNSNIWIQTKFVSVVFKTTFTLDELHFLFGFRFEFWFWIIIHNGFAFIDFLGQQLYAIYLFDSVYQHWMAIVFVV